MFSKNILIAADESENARRAVLYVAGLPGGVKGFKVTVMHVIPKPEEYFFANDAEKENRLGQYKQSGFDPANVSVHSALRWCPSMAECILAERDNLEYGTIVIGRQGLSRKEEFLFGSISGALVRTAKDCAVWVVE